MTPQTDPAVTAAAAATTSEATTTDRTPRFSAVEIADLLGRHRPTDEQVAVIEAPLEPLLVVAGAGSGKTETMAARVVFLIANGLVSPDEVLGLTFTRKAAGELSERIRARLRTLSARLQTSEPGSAAVLRPAEDQDLLAAMQRPTVATYNSYAANLVKEHALRLGIEPGSRLLGEASQWQLAYEIVESWTGDLQTDSAVSGVVKAVLSITGSLSEHLLTEGEARDQMQQIIDSILATPDASRAPGPYAVIKGVLRSIDARIELLDLVAEYRRRKRATESLDFADQVAYAAQLAQEFPQVGESERARFRVVLLDEYQDTSYAQARMLGALFGSGHAVTAVGDPNQSIYGWRGASASGLARFAEQFNNERALTLALSTSWRNDTVILEVANAVSAPLRTEQVGLEVTELVARPGAKKGTVQGAYLTTAEEEAGAVAEFIQQNWQPGARESDRVTAAVLCRARSQFLGIELALRARGIPVEVVGLGGLLNSPEIVDLVALLQVVHDPSRGDSLMRLLTGPRINLGAADLFAVSDRMRELARRQGPGNSRGPAAQEAGAGPEAVIDLPTPEETAVPEADLTDSHSIVDVLEELPPPDWSSSEGRTLSAAARTRLTGLADLLAELRGRTFLSLPELIAEAEESLGLDIEINLGAVTLLERHRSRANLDAFRGVAVSFLDGANTPTLGAFLAWLDAAQNEERGLEQPLAEPDPNAVAIITVHAAKGLEWDVVAVPGLVDGNFPGTKTSGSEGPTDSAWLTGLGTIPYPLRGDSPDLPVFEYGGAADHQELRDRHTDFRRRAGQYEVTQERRLAYVAFTRARSRLLLTGSWFRSGQKPLAPSLFLTELAEAGLLGQEDWARAPGEGETNPSLDVVETLQWPLGAAQTRQQAADNLAADLVRSALAKGVQTEETQAVPTRAVPPPAEQSRDDPAARLEKEPAYGRSLTQIADLLLAERDEGRAPVSEVQIPAHVSASALVRMATDRDAYALELRRPVPTKPSVHAYRGTIFHLWVERFFASPSLVEFDELPSPEEVEPDLDLLTLQANFETSEWAGLDPVAIEVDIETPIAGTSARSRIDAVFVDPQNPNGFVVVDWKTGREPRDPEAVRAREVQLAVYRLAWSRWKDIPVEDVSAAFFYVGSARTVRPEKLWGQTALEALIRGQDPEGA